MSFVDPEASAFGDLAKKVWYWPVIRGVLAIILGILAFAAPLTTVVTIAIVVGIWFIIDGIVAIVDAIRQRGSGGMAFHIIVGIVDLVFGLLLLFWPGKTLLVFVYLAGIWAIVLGVLEIIASIRSRKQNSGWIWGLAVGAIAIIFGIVVAVHPGFSLVTMTWIIGIFAVVFGIFWIIFGFMIRSAGKKASAGQLP
ncbi:HdeD family acid-resistance protein [Microlunatus elymi]|uniref:HdeD family acid-resistance protein n=1 Tax=Microlunatus elymi TaxID=2596828 RepID=A0A516PYM1_9ACTN|nr:HdeD family acid-resistance protein [Microlunatus elymi]QDP96268.1 HdeD family acid-resistance protein [Microlunatus elymi]